MQIHIRAGEGGGRRGREAQLQWRAGSGALSSAWAGVQGIQGSLWGPPLGSTPGKQPLWLGVGVGVEGKVCMSQGTPEDLVLWGDLFIPQTFDYETREKASGVWPWKPRHMLLERRPHPRLRVLPPGAIPGQKV